MKWQIPIFCDLDGKVHHLADFKGKIYVLDFWSSGCGPCIMASARNERDSGAI